MSRLHPDNHPTGLLLIGHGTNNQVGKAEFLEVCSALSHQMPSLVVEPCFLERAEPNIFAAIQQLAAAGVQKAVAVPLLLFAAGHAKRDIPAAVAAAVAGHSSLQISFSDPLNCHQAVLELSSKRFQEAVASQNPLNLDSTMLLMVGRGSSDPFATEQMHRFVELRSSLTSVKKVMTCFLALAEPSLETALAEAATSGAEQIVVQPHLLFYGDLLKRLRLKVESATTQWPHCRWIVAEHLGPAPQITTAVIDRFEESLKATT